MKYKRISSFISLLFIIIVVLFSQNTYASPSGWSKDVRLTFNSDQSSDPAIAVEGNMIHIVYGDDEGGGGSNRYIWYRNSSDYGKTWNERERLTNNPTQVNKLAIAVNGSKIHVVWYEEKDDKIHYINSSDNGITWSNNRAISSLAWGGSGPKIAINSSNIHIVFIATDLLANHFLSYINSTNGGVTWNSQTNLTTIIRDPDQPVIAVNGSNVHIVWKDTSDKFGNIQSGDVFYINSSDNGEKWSDEINLTPLDNDPLWSGYPDIVVNGSNIHVVYVDDRDGIAQVHYKRSEDDGSTWSNDLKLSNSTIDVHTPAIALQYDNIGVAWWDERDDNREIYYKKSLDNGEIWGIDTRLTYDSEYSVIPDIAMSGSYSHVVWADTRDNNPEIYYKHYPVPYPPTNLTIDIWGSNLTLNWTAPKNSPSPVNHYLIYRVTDPNAFTFSDSEIIYNSSGTGNDLLTTWNDTKALLNENNNYYYIVRAIDAEGWNDTNTNIVGKYVIPMKKGWNLISLPLAQRNTSISTVLQTIDGEYNVIWIYDAKEDRWLSSITDFTDINRTMGLWIHMKNSCNLSIIGAVPDSTDIALYEGWNLVGYPSLKPRNLNDALSGITWQAVQHYDAFDVNKPWKHNSTNKPDNLNDLKEMQPGSGYWVYVTINGTWPLTRVFENNKIVVWEVYGLEEKENYHNNYEPLTHNSIDIDEDNNNEIDEVPEAPIDKNKDERIDFSLFPLIILITFVFAEIVLLRKRWR